MTNRRNLTVQQVLDAALAESTHSAYNSYIRKFRLYCIEKDYVDLDYDSLTKVIKDFMHTYTVAGYSAYTVDQIKSSLVYCYKILKISPNPAQDDVVKRYVLGLKKITKKTEEESTKAYPISDKQIQFLLNGLAASHYLVQCYYRLLFCICYLGGFRIGEVLNIRWRDIGIHKSIDNVEYISVRLSWHKKGSVEEESNVYNLYNERGYVFLSVVDFYKQYVAALNQVVGYRMDHVGYVFGLLNFNRQTGVPLLATFNKTNQNKVRQFMDKIVENENELPFGLTLHSFRRGGAFFRVFVSKYIRFDFRQIQSWCRWEDSRTMLGYLLDHRLAKDISPQDLLNPINSIENHNINANEIVEQILRAAKDRSSSQVLPYVSNELQNTSNQVRQPVAVQSSLSNFVNVKRVPTACNAKELWVQWYNGDPTKGLYQPLQSADTRSWPLRDKKDYSPRRIIGKEFDKFQSYEDLELAYVGYSDGFVKFLDEVRRRNRNSRSKGGRKASTT